LAAPLKVNWPTSVYWRDLPALLAQNGDVSQLDAGTFTLAAGFPGQRQLVRKSHRRYLMALVSEAVEFALLVAKIDFYSRGGVEMNKILIAVLIAVGGSPDILSQSIEPAAQATADL
jgi:hypothetical protein